MKKLLITVLATCPIVGFSQQVESNSNLGSQQLLTYVSMINKSLETAQASLKDVQIKKASLDLKTAYVKDGGGGFKLLFKASKKWSAENSSHVTYNFTAPKASTYESFNGSDVLANAIVNAASEWKSLGSNTVSGLVKDDFQVGVAFTMTRTTTGGVEFSILGIGADLSGDYENSAVHTIELSFK